MVTLSNAQSNMVSRLREEIATARADFDNLDRELGPDLRSRLVSARHKLDEVESLFLSPEILSEPRTDAAMLRWLAHAQPHLEHAKAIISQVGEQMRKYGPDAKVIY